ncbi:hypothetical protein [Roseobacter ponti]|uniref:Uncharacterized protein n=1 Tax=Roseobacter ponti TaxID=1891787 RepID=A0A858SVA0_9RHOB|nr:hypothetical protein [Roseobacter ponti]QJF52889.1 hypothetical protein G3256_17775 [Roseobacter ponti]
MNAVGPVMPSAVQAQLICLLDDLTRQAITAPRMGVALAGRPEDIVVLGFLSLYQTDPVHSYALASDTDALSASVRFGALHQTVRAAGAPGTDHLPALKELAGSDNVTLITGRADAGLPGPFSASEIGQVLDRLPQGTDRTALLQDTFRPLIGSVLSLYGQGFSS